MSPSSGSINCNHNVKMNADHMPDHTPSLGSRMVLLLSCWLMWPLPLQRIFGPSPVPKKFEGFRRRETALLSGCMPLAVLDHVSRDARQCLRSSPAKSLWHQNVSKNQRVRPKLQIAFVRATFASSSPTCPATESGIVVSCIMDAGRSRHLPAPARLLS